MSWDGTPRLLGNVRGWPLVPLRSLVTRKKESGRTDLPLLSVNLAGVRLRDADDGRMAASEDQSHYNVVKRGDLLMNPLGKPHGPVGVSDWDGITSPAYWVMSVNQRWAHPRYMHHLLRSDHLVAEYKRLGKYMPPNQFDIAWVDFRDIVLPLPPLEEQRRIAHLLDAETARIDRLIELRKEQGRLVAEHHEARWARLTLEFQPGVWVPLRRVLRSICDGPFGSSLTSQHYSADGARVVRLGNIGRAAFRDDDRAFIPLEYYESLRAHEVKPGDVVVAGLGDGAKPLGRACVVPDDLGPAVVKADCFRVRVHPAIDPWFLSYALSAPPVTERTATLSRGATRERINTEVARDILIPLAGPAEQRRYVNAVRETEGWARQFETLSGSQILALTERRQALVTAAVTGRLDAPTARGAA